MAEMKDSGISWVGMIPKHWNINKGKYFIAYIERAVRDDDEVVTCFRDGEVTLRSNRREDGFTVSEKEIGYQGINEGDLIVHGMDGFAGAIGISDSKGKASPVLNVLEPNGDKRFYMYYLRNMAYGNVFLALSTGIRVRTCDTNWKKLRELPYLIPPVEEQIRIADYIEKKCSEIEALHSDIENQIETLEEYKKSAITEAVTKGLNPDVEMKDSGVEWIGRIPKDWSVTKGKYLFGERTSKGNRFNLELLSPTQKYGVIPQTLYEELSTMRAVKVDLNKDISDFKTIHNGDFCISLRSFEGGIEYCNYEGVVSPAYKVLYPLNNDVYRGYYKHVLKEKGFISKIASYSDSLRDGKSISYGEFGKTILPLPPLDQQIAIADYLDDKCAEVDGIIKDKKKQLETLEEYKKSLIYEYVTGKKEVPDND